MTPRQVFWHNLLADVAALRVGECVDRNYGDARLVGEIRSQIGGAWRAYLPGSTYHVRLANGAARITRTA
ncbi:MAG: hypothetical protein ACRDRL_25920 [Sciscionella sp.]